MIPSSSKASRAERSKEETRQMHNMSLVNLTFMIKMCLKCIETEQNDGSIITVIFIFMRTTSQFKTKTCILHNSVTVRLRTFIFLDQSMADSFEMRSIVSTAWLLPDVCCCC
jgi:hypothetical protein